MARPIRASIIIVTYNSEGYIADCLESVASSVSNDCEIIVVDNASTDGTADRVSQTRPEVRLIQSPRNVGFGSANNLGAQAARGKILVALNPDAIASEGWLEPLIGPLEQSAEAERLGATTPRILLLRARGTLNACGNVVHVSGVTTCRGLGKPSSDPEFLSSSEVVAISGACFAMRAELWSAIGGFDDDFFMYLEDTEMSLRLALAGYRCRYIPSAVIYHDYQGAFPSAKLYYLERNRLLMMLGSFSRTSVMALLPSLCAVELLVWSFAALRGASAIAAKWHSYIWLWRNRSRIGLKRRTMRLPVDPLGEAWLLENLAMRLDLEQVAPPGLARFLSMLTAPLFGISKSVAGFAIRLRAHRPATSLPAVPTGNPQ